MPNTVILSGSVNSDFSDIANALTDSLARDGQGGMTAQLQLAPAGFTYTNDPDTGMSRSAANTQVITCDNVDVVTFDPDGMAVSGDFLVDGARLLPIGVVAPFAGSSAPAKWLLCAGQSLLRANYALLFAAIGTTYGAVDGTHFTLPDLRGRAAVGKDDMGGTAANRITTAGSGIDGVTLGASGGSQSHTLVIGEIPSHDHGGTTGAPSGTLADTIPSKLNAISNVNSGGGVQDAVTSSGTTSVTAINAHTHTISAAGGGGAHNNVQPTLILNYIIYAGV